MATDRVGIIVVIGYSGIVHSPPYHSMCPLQALAWGQLSSGKDYERTYFGQEALEADLARLSPTLGGIKHVK